MNGMIRITEGLWMGLRLGRTLRCAARPTLQTMQRNRVVSNSPVEQSKNNLQQNWNSSNMFNLHNVNARRQLVGNSTYGSVSWWDCVDCVYTKFVRNWSFKKLKCLSSFLLQFPKALPIINLNNEERFLSKSEKTTTTKRFAISEVYTLWNFDS